MTVEGDGRASPDLVPTFADFMIPTLSVLADGADLTTRETANRVADELDLSNESREIAIPSGQPMYLSRGQWAQTYLAQAGLLSRPRRGVVRITEEGRAVLQKGYTRLTPKMLEEYPSFQAFQMRKRDRSANDALVAAGGSPTLLEPEADEALSPRERLDSALKANLAEVHSELLDKVRSLEPSAFERLVLKLLVGMGYGTEAQSLQTGRSGDEGIDGLVHRDALGLDRVYMQAKRYTENAVGPEAINAFYGALQRKGADRGVFITSSTFTEGARRAEKDFRNVVLVDGERLVRLMAEHGVGVEVVSTHKLKRINDDYFEEL